jgi:replicative DNA helicase
MHNPLTNLAVESAVIGQILMDATGRCMDSALESGVDHEFFSDIANQVAWYATETIYRASGSIDELMLFDWVARHRVSDVPWLGKNDTRPLAVFLPKMYIHDVMSKIDHLARFPQHLTILKNLWALRHIAKVGQTVALKAERGGMEFTNNPDALISEVEKVVDEVAHRLAPKSTRHIAESFALVDQMTVPGTRLLGLSTGLQCIDDTTEGLKGGEVWVLAARPSLGKTSLACQVGMHCAMPKPSGEKPPATIIFSLEMPADHLAARLISSHSDVSLKRLRDGMAGDVGRSRYEQSKKVIAKSSLYIEDATDLTVAQMKAICRKYEREHKLGVVVIDYLQLVNPADRRMSREQQISQMTRDIKKMAKELRVPIVLLAQLNRKSETEERDPRPSDLRDGGSIEQDADVVLFLVNRNKDCGAHTATQEVDIIVAKNRNGRSGERMAMRFTGPTYRFDEDPAARVVAAPEKKYPNVQKKIDATPSHPF